MLSSNSEIIKRVTSSWSIFIQLFRYNIFGSDWCNVWRIPREDLQKKNLCPAVKHGDGSMMVWGCMAVSGVGSLHFIEGVVNKHVYINTVWRCLIASAEALGGARKFFILPRLWPAPKHSSCLVRRLCLYSWPKVIKTAPQLPDLNVIENLWAKLRKEIEITQFPTKKL